MSFLCDENIDRRLAGWLRSQNHDVTVARDYARPLSDSQLLAIAHREHRTLITNDRDFGELVFRQRQSHTGVIYLRLGAADLAVQITRLEAVLRDPARHLDRFLVVSARSVRVRPTR